MPTSGSSIVSSQGSTLSFGGSIGHITAIDVTRSGGTIDTSDLSLANGDPRAYEPAQLLDGDEIKVEALYSSAETNYPAVGDEDTLTTSVGGITGTAICTASSVKYAVGEVVKLSMTFRIGGTLD